MSIRQFIYKYLCGLQQLSHDIIITIGCQTGDYSINCALCRLQNAEH